MKILATILAMMAWGSSVLAQDSCVVRGRLLGCDGRPMRSAFVRVYKGERGIPRRPARPDGAFSVTLPGPGMYQAFLGGVHHRTLVVSLFVEHPDTLELTVRLAAAEYVDAFDSVRVIGSFNGFAPESALAMVRGADGTFVADVPCDRDTLRYELLGVQAGGLPICGTQADTFIVDRSQNLLEGRSNSFLCAIVAGRRPVRVVFDPARLPRCDAVPAVTFVDSLGRAASMAGVTAALNNWERTRSDAMETFLAAGGAPDSFRWDAGPAMKDLFARADRERDPLSRGYLLLNTVGFNQWGVDSVRAAIILREVQPDSPLWSLLSWRAVPAFDGVAYAAKLPEQGRDYAERVAATQPDSSVGAAFLYRLLSNAEAASDTGRAARYYAKLMSDFPGTEAAITAQRQFSPTRAIMEGKPCPAFAFRSLEDSTVVLRLADLRGHYLLLDFWATWCAPCVAEVPNLENAYRVYKDRGLKLLSVSFDEGPEFVRRFRRSRSPMPWLHAFEPQGFLGEAAGAFEIVGIPRPILIDPSGRIVATEDGLRGGNLAKTLAGVFGARSAGSARKE
jgi:thiol-disulfide isomerase/thioredoxin